MSRRRGGVNGAKARVGIRPEMLTILLEETDSAEHEVTGEVADTSYYGDMTYYTIRLPGAEAPATVSMRNTAGRRILHPGDRARVGWGRDSVLLLSRAAVGFGNPVRKSFRNLFANPIGDDPCLILGDYILDKAWRDSYLGDQGDTP